ncbi:hypothetical protein SDRG_04984 [Saprolegnia diclina VS20]|uniref:BTB domain-containing protein n=1 Tax=Saprolegnia diclina (strain VS20) TaxID=1156394 RepID=T0QTP5_SAPDV|nr:hypothetical protein SDRG_04984 [Saprolegnia diclina VS20]EQC37380.1 hypothetical protein SDRG_04984 [Saprolegnia diclina VS20]|eukprot:XP_008608900.1 hypothetical protein SDRG_04984 [Saprolegnia diclina VS20]
MVDGLNLRDRCAALQASVAALDEAQSDALRKLVDELSAIASDVATKEEALRLHEAALREREVRIDAKLELLAQQTATAPPQVHNNDVVREEGPAQAKLVTLNVGGTLFTTARDTLLRMRGSYFDAMLSSDRWCPNAKGEYFLDLDPTLFPRVMKLLRTGTLDVEGLTINQEADVREMLDYLQIQIESPAPVPSAPMAPLQWDPRRCSTKIQLADDNTLAAHGSYGYASVVASQPASTFAVLIMLGSHAEVGFLPLDDETSPVPDRKSTTRGWFFSCSDGRVFSHDEAASISLVDATVKRLALLQVAWHRLQQRISFAVDGVLLPMSLHNVVSDVDFPTLHDRCAALQASVAALDETTSDALCKLVDELSAIASDVATKEEALRLHEAALREREARLDAKLELLAELKADNHRHETDADTAVDQLPTPAKTITLNVGGTLFTTARETLLRMPGSYFDAMLSCDHWLPNEKGEYFLDLDASTFARVIKYLRTGTLNLSGLSNTDEDELREMLDYLQIEWPLPAPSAPPVPVETPRLQWDPLHCSEAITLDEGNTRARSQKHGWSHVLASTPATNFGVLVTLRSEVLVGFMVLDDFVQEPDFRLAQNRRGWVFDCSIGALSSHYQPTTAHVVDTTKPRPIFLQVTLHQQQQRVSFAIDGIPLPASLHHVPMDAVLYPVVRILSGGAVVKLLPV